MKYSIIIPYRNRESQLSVLLPRLQEKFEDTDYEIIISEQEDDNNFQIAAVNNVGALESSGDILIFHQVDYFPGDDLQYDPVEQVTLVGALAHFLNESGESLRSFEDIPGGYRNFYKGIDPNFYGGVVMMSRETFFKINGFNTLYKGWGNEDEDLRERLKHYNIPVKRQTAGTFFCLYHKDNGAMHNMSEDIQKDFQDGRTLLRNWKQYLHVGLSNFTYTSQKSFPFETSKIKWVYSTDYSNNL
jgi:beta-1,4-galactosyltransferase 4